MPDAARLFGEGGQAGTLMRRIDWASTKLGPVDAWPQSLRAMIPAMLASRFAMRVVWGPDHIMLYNDAYLPVLGKDKHPRAMGAPTRESFPELWHIVEPLFQRVYRGEAVALTDSHLPLHRNGYLEECYFTLSYSPMRDDDGAIAGLLGVISETTERVLAERRLRTLRALAAFAASATSGSVTEAAVGAVATLADDKLDVPYALLYLGKYGESTARLAAVAGVEAGTVAAPEAVPLASGGALWPLADARQSVRRVDTPPETFGPLPGGNWPEPSRLAVVLPLARAGIPAFLIVGTSPRRAFDRAYADFLDLAADQMGAILAATRAHAEERRSARSARLRADVGTALTSDAGLDTQLARCAEALRAELDGATVGVWTTDAPGTAARLTAAAGEPGAAEASEVASVLASGRAVFREMPPAPGQTAFVAHPLVAGGRVVGAIGASSPRPFGPVVVDLLSSVAEPMAAAVERHRNEQERLNLQAREQSALAEAKRQRARLASLFMQTPAAICVLRGPDHVYELANPRYLSLIGGRDVLGRPLREALPEAAPVVVPILDGVFSRGEPYFGNEFPVVLARNGRPEECFFNFIYQPIFDAEDAVEGIAVVAFEVTDQVRARQRSEALAAELESTNRDLDQFAYVASHDLKAPLRGIASLSEWIEEALVDKMSGETRRQMDLLRGRVHRLEALIDGILDYSRAGRVREKVEPVDVGALLAECRDLLAPRPEARVDIAPDMPTVMAERIPLQQIFLNLMSNALKHAGRPDVHIAVGWADAGTAYDFTVRDDGGGIPPQFHERIWGIFQTLQPRDRVEGTGIGLSVVKKLVESRGGQVSLESEAGAGATFHVLWPKRAKESP
ncbi:MAG TPA: ATP-binding protein [Polyangia bacterium]|nr:ATP-binding protein [Polyangia bacterium]